MGTITGITRGGTEWTPSFVTELKQSKCIGCGRCFKVCPREVFELIDREEDEGLDAAEEGDDDGYYDDEDDGFSDDTSMVMSLRNALDCIGCEACTRVCPKSCFVHAPAGVPA